MQTDTRQVVIFYLKKTQKMSDRFKQGLEPLIIKYKIYYVIFRVYIMREVNNIKI